jgi:hypothetical protein
MDVRTTILAHEPVEHGSQELHRFIFSIQDALNPTPTRNGISLHTARVLASEVLPTTAFGQMVLTIAHADPADYDDLIGKTFTHLSSG